MNALEMGAVDFHKVIKKLLQGLYIHFSTDLWINDKGEEMGGKRR